MDDEITIQVMKYGNHRHYDWKTKRLEQTDSHILVLGEYGRQLNHYTKQQTFIIDHWTIEFFSFDLWFTVSADVVDGRISQYYCNINEPAKLEGNTVSFVDLDLDYVQRNGAWKVVDEDEFEINSVKFNYPESLIRRTRLELDNLQDRVKNNKFPFDGTLERFIPFIPR